MRVSCSGAASDTVPPAMSTTESEAPAANASIAALVSSETCSSTNRAPSTSMP
jgi:hypothetical protein